MAAPSVEGQSLLSRDAGWIAGGIVIVAVLIAGAALWFMHHP